MALRSLQRQELLGLQVFLHQLRTILKARAMDHQSWCCYVSFQAKNICRDQSSACLKKARGPSGNGVERRPPGLPQTLRRTPSCWPCRHAGGSRGLVRWRQGRCSADRLRSCSRPALPSYFVSILTSAACGVVSRPNDVLYIQQTHRSLGEAHDDLWRPFAAEKGGTIQHSSCLLILQSVEQLIITFGVLQSAPNPVFALIMATISYGIRALCTFL